MAGVGDHHAVEAQLLLQKAGDEFRSQGGRQDVLVHQRRVQLLGVVRQRDVTRHDHLDAVVNVVAVDTAEGGIPLGGGELVYAQHKVLVAFLGAVARKMLDACDHVAGSAGTVALDVRAGVLDDVIGVRAVGAGVDDGVAPVEQDIDARVEVDVDAECAGFPGRHIACVICHLRVARGLGLRAGRDVGAVGAGAVATRIAVRGDQQRDLGVRLQAVEQLLDSRRFAAMKARAADVVLLEDLRVSELVAAEHVLAEEKQVGE